tara:strand:+ start:3723 stop:4001 length:279 start_codon:yes stop_codon:yes gene_type:complete
MISPEFSTKLANQRTYLAYMRTGLGIASIAGTFKHKWIAMLGLIMILVNIFQYIYINKKISLGEDPNNNVIDMIPLLYGIMSVSALYLQFYK